jgi:hypothetical protein
MDIGTVLGGVSLFFSIVGIIYSAINHKHIRSKCCGKELEISIDIDTTVPEKKPQNSPVKVVPRFTLPSLP